MAAEEAIALKAAEEEAIKNMKDPIQSLFLSSIKSLESSGGLEDASPEVKAELQANLDRLAKQFGGSAAEDMTAFPSIQFEEPEIEPINISQ